MKGCNKFIVWASGGKDSTANIIKLIKLGYRNFDIIFIDTGIEWEQMYEFVEKLKSFVNKYGCKFHTYKSQYTWESVFYRVKQKGKNKGDIYGFPYTCGAWCNARLKGEPFAKAKQDFKGYVEYIGYAIDEKSKLRQLKIQNKLKGIDIFETRKTIIDKKTGIKSEKIITHDITNERYLLCDYNMTEKDCLELTKKYDLYNPLYELFGRTGCWCCPKQPLKSLRIIYNNFPEKWEQLKIWQKDSKNTFKINNSIFDLDKRFKEENTKK